MDVAAGIWRRHFLQALGAGVVGGVRSAEPSSNSGITGTSASSAISLALRVAIVGGSATNFSFSLRMASASAGGRLRSITRRGEFLALRIGHGIKTAAPIGVGAGALLADIAPGGQHVVGDLERAVIPAQRLLPAQEFVGAERLAMGFRGARFGRRAEADGGLAGDQRRAVGRLRLRDRGRDRLLVVAVDPDRVPAMGLEARHLVDIVGERDRAVDGDAVIVVQEDQLLSFRCPASAAASWLTPSIRSPSEHST